MERLNAEISGLESEIEMLERKLDQYRSDIMICEDGVERHRADVSKAHGGNNRLMMLLRAFTDVNDKLERKFDELKKAKMTIPIVWRETKEGRKASLDSYCLHLVYRERAAEDLLVINYEKNILEQFGGKGFQIYPSDWKLGDVFLLNLTSSRLHAMFCGKDGRPQGIVG